jgi:hypothetical protein
MAKVIDRQGVAFARRCRDLVDQPFEALRLNAGGHAKAECLLHGCQPSHASISVSWQALPGARQRSDRKTSFMFVEIFYNVKTNRLMED